MTSKGAYRIREVDGHEEEIADTLKELHTETFQDTAPQIDPNSGFWWLCYFDGDTPVAFAGLEPSAVWDDVGYLNRSGVIKAHRGNGLQLRLIRAREAKAKRLGWAVMRTDTTDNIPSANTLIRAGYRLFEPNVRWAFENSLYWRKEFK